MSARGAGISTRSPTTGVHFGVRAAVLIACTVLPAPLLQGQVRFTDVSARSGFSGTEMYSLNIHGLGVTWLDFDNDGWQDLFIVNGKGRKKELYRNLGNRKFELRNDLLPSFQNVEFMGAVAGDYDNDGDVDLYVFTDHEDAMFIGGPIDGPANLLLKNRFIESGGSIPIGFPLFVDVAAEAGVDGLADPPLGPDYPGYRDAIGGFLDYDRDGFLDLSVGTWAMPADAGSRANADFLYRNNGDGTFSDVTALVGLPTVDDRPEMMRPTLGFIAAHLNEDLWPDLYVGHTALEREDAIDLLFLNDGAGAFVDAAPGSPGLGDDATANMGVAVSDIENDGDFDLYMSDLIFDFDPTCNPLYLNHGDGTFTDDVAEHAGVAANRSWAVVFFDADHDKFEDLFVGVTTAVPHFNYFYVNNGDGTFRDESARSGVAIPGNTRGGAAADYDNDGDMDLAFVDLRTVEVFGGLRLFRNDTLTAGHWLKVALTGTASNRSAIGARLTVYVGDDTLSRQIVGGSGAHGQNSLVAHFGLGDATEVDKLKIEWPSGAINIYRHVAIYQLLDLEEQSECQIALEAAPESVAVGEKLAFTTSGGAPYQLMLLYTVTANGLPEYIEVDMGGFDAHGVRVWSTTIPPEYSGLTVTLQSIGIEACTGRLGVANTVEVTIE